MAFLLAQDIISGKEGKVLTTINGVVKEHAEIKAITASIEKTKTEVRTLGQRGTQHKATGWNGTGSVTFYYVTSEWARQMIQYCKTGKDLYFDMTVINEDEGSGIGKQTVLLKQCNIDSIEIAKLDAEAELLDTSFDFTFSDIDILDGFTALT